MKLFHFKQAAPDLDVEVDEWEIDKIVGHRQLPSGEYEFLVQWSGCDRSRAQWEPVGHFFHRYAEPFIAYCRSKNLLSTVNVLQHLAARPPAAVATVGITSSLSPSLPGVLQASPSPQEVWTEPPEDWPVDLVSAGPDSLGSAASRPLSNRWAFAVPS